MGRNILFLTFYYTPDLSAGSFRNTQLVQSLSEQMKRRGENGKIIVITSMPNRYGSFHAEALRQEIMGDILIYRVPVGTHKSGLIHQALIYWKFLWAALILQRKYEFDLVYASSSRLMTAFLGAIISRLRNRKLYLDIRDIFRESISDLIQNDFAKTILNWFLKRIEKFTFKRASIINVVTTEMTAYFKDYRKEMRCFTNGIDEMFFSFDFKKQSQVSHKKVIVFAGNIGKAQALHKVVPLFAKHFEDELDVKIIGDGSAKKELIDGLKREMVSNVEIIDPVQRNILLDYYKSCDCLLLNLDDKEAFYKAIPSKLFEYAATGKTILAGVKGFTHEFVTENINNVLVYNSNNYEELISKFSNLEIKESDRSVFLSKYRRRDILRTMSDDILTLIDSNKNSKL